MAFLPKKNKWSTMETSSSWGKPMINQAADIKAWLKKHAMDLADIATFGFKKLGRGAVVVDYTSRSTDASVPNYISTGQLQAIGVRDTDTFRALANYDPLREAVVLILFSDGAQPFKLTAHPIIM
jgi:hypothetical protein